MPYQPYDVREERRHDFAAKRCAQGPKEYWREVMVGKYTYGLDNHSLTDAEFEAEWAETENDA